MNGGRLVQVMGYAETTPPMMIEPFVVHGSDRMPQKLPERLRSSPPGDIVGETGIDGHGLAHSALRPGVPWKRDAF